MWPWEHAIVGYLVYSLFCRLYYRESPGGVDAFAAVFASVLPDLIDKPLAWEFGVFDAGYAIGHSVFFAVPLSIAVGALARSADYPRAGVAFALGYLFHLPADVVDGLVRDGHFTVWIVFWPFGTDAVPPSDYSDGFTAQFAGLFARYVHELLSGDPSAYILLQLGLVVAAASLWLYDGAPVAREAFDWTKRSLRSAARSRNR